MPKLILPMPLPVPVAKRPDYHALLGIFHSNWSAIDLCTDFAIYQFLNVTAEQAHLITSGMFWGRKARLLSDLIKHSSDSRKQALLASFGSISKAKREIITHAYVASDADSVIFLERGISGPFKVTEHTYSLTQFQKHAKEVHDAAVAFQAALGCSQSNLNQFVKAAFNLNTSSTKSPQRPTSSRLLNNGIGTEAGS